MFSFVCSNEKETKDDELEKAKNRTTLFMNRCDE